MDTRLLEIMDDVYNENGGKPMLLARFGDLFHEKRKMIDTHPLEQRIGKLVDASGKYKRVQPSSKAAWWVCLLDQEVDSENTLSNIRNSLLLALSKKVPDGMNRYYHKVRPYGFKDCEIAPTTSDYIKIDSTDLVFSSDIPPKDMSKDEIGKLSAHAIAWAERHGLSHDAIYVEKKETPPPSSLLDRLINALTEEDRKRISLPLDIIAKLAHYK